MQRVLLAIAYCMPDVGYCQGMNFIASVLISVTESEQQGFIIFMYLLISKEMKPLFLPVSVSCSAPLLDYNERLWTFVGRA